MRAQISVRDRSRNLGRWTDVVCSVLPPIREFGRDAQSGRRVTPNSSVDPRRRPGEVGDMRGLDEGVVRHGVWQGERKRGPGGRSVAMDVSGAR